MKFYNTLLRKKEEFIPIKEDEVGLYTCGPTVHDFAHIGNFRTFIFEDILRRTLELSDHKVNHVMNLTDIEDRIIQKAKAANVSIREYTQTYIDEFLKDSSSLKIERPKVYPRVTDHINEIIKTIETLIEKGVAYQADDKSVYFAISKFKSYGHLSKLDIGSLLVGARVAQDEYEKEKPADFVLWRAHDPEDGDVYWESPWGKGRPGWHIECSTMSMKYLGNHFDIHTGGVDNIFPHHENEIAQSEAATGEKFVNYWLHCEHLLIEGKKMSKRDDNFYTVRDLLEKGYDPLAIRYLLAVGGHYRSKLDFSLRGLDSAASSIDRINNFLISVASFINNPIKAGRNLKVREMTERVLLAFRGSLYDDLNLPDAMGHIFSFVRNINDAISNEGLSQTDAKRIVGVMKQVDSIIAVMKFTDGGITKQILELVKMREQARESGEWEQSDQLRRRIEKLGYTLEDTKTGPRLKLRKES